MPEIEKQITCQTDLNESTAKAIEKHSAILFGKKNRGLLMRQICEEYVKRKGSV